MSIKQFVCVKKESYENYWEKPWPCPLPPGCYGTEGCPPHIVFEELRKVAIVLGNLAPFLESFFSQIIMNFQTVVIYRPF